MVTRAAAAVEQRAAGASASAGPGSPSSGTTRRHALLADALPALRGALLADADGVVLEVDRSPEAVAFASSSARPRSARSVRPARIT